MNIWPAEIKPSSVPVSTFQDTGRNILDLTLVAGEAGLVRSISEAAINRTGLALSGFYQHFANRRVQVFGLAEYAYLNSLQEAERHETLRVFFEQKIPCVVVARNKKIFPEMIAMANKKKIPLFRSRQITKDFVNAATIVMENLMAPTVKVQGTMVEIMGVGVLIVGRSGMGKSDTALSLIKKGHALVSDDITRLRLDSDKTIMGYPVRMTRYHMEIRGVGIIHVPSLFGVASIRGAKRLDMIATLCTPEQIQEEKRGAGKRRVRKLLGIEVPEVLVEVTPGRDLANVVETAALDQKLRNLGHDAEKELDERVMEALSGGVALGD